MYEDFGFTHNECLYDKVNSKRLYEFMSKYEVVGNDRSTNNYGEFRFVTVRIPRIFEHDDGSLHDVWVTFYGNGFNDCSGTNIRGSWKFYVSYNDTYGNPVNSILAIHEIMQEERDLPREEEYSDDDTDKFSILSSLGDDDSAYTETYQ